MKKIVTIVVSLILLFYSTNVYAKIKYNESYTFINDYIKKYNGYNKYIVSENTKYGFKDGEIYLNSNFKTGGLLNKYEFELSLDENGSTYLFNGLEYFTMTINDDDTVVTIDPKKYDYLNNQNQNYSSNVRITNYIQNGVRVTGSGTKVDPWIFIDKYTIRYDSNGGDACNPSIKYVYYGSNIGQLCTTNRAGYEFDGWYTDAINGDLVTENTVVNNNMILFAHWSESHNSVFTFNYTGKFKVYEDGTISEEMNNTNYTITNTDWKVYFLSSGIFSPQVSEEIDIFTVGGGGGGGGQYCIDYYDQFYCGAGGGGGGYVANYSNYSISNNSYSITIGEGGAAGVGFANSTSHAIEGKGGNGGTSSFNYNDTIVIAANGGIGGNPVSRSKVSSSEWTPVGGTGGAGGSGGGGGKCQGASTYESSITSVCNGNISTGGTNGSNGGAGGCLSCYRSASYCQYIPAGGSGSMNSTKEFGDENAVAYGAGGGGGAGSRTGPVCGSSSGAGGDSGGGAGGYPCLKSDANNTGGNGKDGIDNTGGGGGGASACLEGNFDQIHYGGKGGSGIVIIRNHN